ncbi:MAG TPA: DUF1015 domain-containing protein [Syntrophomonadaceae bacterium]|nr:DUF1015 domain-containing protein [Syntrophomonadaceae bacterium]HPU49160.1 DUF1015 domain-containing protein [Syntrophomonadaceae bacterium]
MATIVPFRGLRYNPEKICDLSQVVTPPYDVIDDIAQARYYAQHPANVIRLELGLTYPQDTASNNRYSRANQYLEKWLEEEVLIPDPQPSLYIYEQEFAVKGKRMIRTGLVTGLKVEPYESGVVLPHEETLSKPKADRLQLMRATRSNFSSIFGLYFDPQQEVVHLLRQEINDQPPAIDIIDEVGEAHRVWVIDNKKVIDRVVELFRDKQIYIADGHHRYETALEYAQEMKEQGQPGYDYVLTTLVNVYDPGLLVLPTHRLVGNLSDFNARSFQDRLADLFTLEKFGSLDDLPQLMAKLEEQRERHVFGMAMDEQLYFLVLKDWEKAAALLPSERSSSWKALDVAILDNLILDNILGIGEAQRRSQDNLTYSRDEEWVVDQIRNRNYQLGFLLNPTQVQEIIDVAQARDKMPQKSTYFYPKLITGLIINKLDI